jgi:hypothetical protein
MKVFAVLCMLCVLAVASSQKASSYSGSSDCSGDAASSTTVGKCEKPEGADKYYKATLDGKCEKGMTISTQPYSDKDCATKDGDATESKWDYDVDKCIDLSVTVMNVTTKASMKLDCSPASVKTFMPVMTAFAIVVAMFSQ